MDAALRAAERNYARAPTKANERQLRQAQRRAGYTEHYVPCNCNQQTRRTRRGNLCTKCCGQGWIEIVWVPFNAE